MQSPWKTAWGAWRASTCQNRRADRLNGSPQVAQGTSSTRPATQPRAPPCPERGRALEFAHPTLFPMIALMFTRDITSVHKLPPRAGVLGPSGSQPDANEMSNGQMEGTFTKCTFLTIGFPSKCFSCLGGQAECQRVCPWFGVPGLGKGESHRDLRDKDQADARTKKGQMVQRKHPPEGQVAR